MIMDNRIRHLLAALAQHYKCELETIISDASIYPDLEIFINRSDGAKRLLKTVDAGIDALLEVER